MANEVGVSAPSTDTVSRSRLSDPKNYIPDPNAQAAIEVAKLLHQPLLVTGPPGVGKSQLAAWVAHTEEARLIKYTAKSTTTAGDLLYRFDAVRQFRDQQIKALMAGKQNPGDPALGSTAADVPIKGYLAFQALGRSICLTYDPNSEEMKALWDEEANRVPGEDEFLQTKAPCNSVVLIDEIDKAPRDVPNDLLVEFETRSFLIPEARYRLSVQKSFDPIVIATSNSEKALPDAFLRRCIFLNLTIPKGETLKQIIEKQIVETKQSSAASDAVVAFEKLHDDADVFLRRKPSVAELLGLLLFACVHHGKAEHFRKHGLRKGLIELGDGGPKIFSQWMSILFKTQEDFSEGLGWFRQHWALPEHFEPKPA